MKVARWVLKERGEEVTPPSTLTNPAKRRYVEAAEAQGIIIEKKNITCDEYPFYGSEQGGRENYYASRVSLQLVPTTEAGLQGTLMGDTNLQNAGVVKGDVFLKWYGVVSVPALPVSFWRERNINSLFS